MLHYGSMGQVQSKECNSKCAYTLLGIVFLLFVKKLCFIIFISLFDKVSNLRNKVLTNQKPKLLIKNCQWNCLLQQIYVTVEQVLRCYKKVHI